MFVFGAALLLLLCSGSESEHQEFVKEGDAAALTCDNLQPGQELCDGTTWLYVSVDDPGNSVELISLGQIDSSVSERLSLTQDCGLQIKDVQSDDAGRYICQQYDSSETGPPLTPDTLVTLSVVSVTEEKKKNDLLTLICSVSTSLDSSSVGLKWRLSGQEVDEDNSQIQMTPFHYGLKIIIKKPHPVYGNKHLLKCAVTHEDKTHLFSLTSQSSEETGTTPPPPSPSTKDDDDKKEQRRGGSSWWTWAAVAAAAAVVLLLVSLALVVWRRRRVKRRDTSVVLSEAPGSKGPQGERGETGPAEEPEEVNYASINFHDHHRTEVRRSEEAVTYSSVRNQAPDSAQLYATVNKPNQKHI